MDNLPPELVAKLVEQVAAQYDPSRLLAPHRASKDLSWETRLTLRNLCLTSRMLNTMTTSQLYSRIIVVDSDYAEQLFETLTARSDLANLVQSLHIYAEHYNSSASDWVNLKFPDLPACIKLSAQGSCVSEDFEVDGGGGGNMPAFTTMLRWSQQCPQLTTISMEGTIDPTARFRTPHSSNSLSDRGFRLPASLTILELRQTSYHFLRNTEFLHECADWVTELRPEAKVVDGRLQDPRSGKTQPRANHGAIRAVSQLRENRHRFHATGRRPQLS